MRSRVKLFKLLTKMGFSTALVPAAWKKPVIKSVVLPAHALFMSDLDSDRNIKENIGVVNEQAILQKLETLPIESWNYKGDETPHIGPMAQDFKAAFNLGDSDRHIHVVDMNGVNMASIKALSRLVKEQSAQLEALKEEISILKSGNS